MLTLKDIENMDRSTLTPAIVSSYLGCDQQICYNTPFPEMQGNIIYVDYECSSWKYMSYERSFQKDDLEAFKIGGAYQKPCDTIEPYLIGKGGGSAYGGEIKPAKPEDERFWGEPDETKYSYTAKGELIETLIGSDGKVYVEIHHTAFCGAQRQLVRWPTAAERR